MKRLIAAACGLAVGLTGVLAGPDDPDPAAVKRLVARLGSDQYSDREAAARALEKLGAAALPALRAAARDEDPEVRARAAALVTRLTRATESASRLAPRRVKLDYRDTPLGAAVNDLRARTGLPVTLDGARIADPLRKVTCETGELPAWEALDAFCRAAGLVEVFAPDLDVPKPANRRRGEFVPPPDPKPDAVPVVLADGRGAQPAGDRSTAVRVLALPPAFPGHRASIGTGRTTLCLDVTPAPGLNWQGLVGVKVSRVVDSAGRPGSGGGASEPDVSPAFDPTGTVVFARPGVAIRFDATGNAVLPETIPNPRIVPVQLTVATAGARSLKRLEGVVYGELLVLDQHLVTITDLSKNTGKPFAGPDDLKVTLLEVRGAPRGGQGVVRVQFEYTAPWLVNARKRGPGMAFNPGWPETPQPPSLSRTLRAFDALGKPFPVTASGTQDFNFSDDGMTHIQTMHFTFRGESGLPAKLAVVGPKSVFVEVPFAMENVPLP